MTFPDQSHINYVRNALWQNTVGGASIMIGAGLSRLSQIRGVANKEMPLWKDISTVLCSRLYPNCNASEIAQYPIGTSNTLRLAQEFEGAFGRGELNNLIREIVPDEDYQPSELHVRLLNLPWKDVFTTNWDTLLERTRPIIIDRAYSVVRTCDEIPAAMKPRIIKLHGSLPANFPFIITEEDYRTYPSLFSPFVNTAQQAMMETVFLLVGFSAEDPNFLRWAGWVRDNLGVSAPRIYLAGWLKLSPHRRSMLEKQNIVPIDLANHPLVDKWPEHLYHKYAVEWILHTLERGQPYDIRKWPNREIHAFSDVPEMLEPVESLTFQQPMMEPEIKYDYKNVSTMVDLLKNASRVWEHNRKLYPGWLTIPPENIQWHEYHKQREIIKWEDLILQNIANMAVEDTMLLLKEYVWRLEIHLMPISEKLESAIEAVLYRIDCQDRKIDNTEKPKADWQKLRECWRELSIALVTVARHRFDNVCFDKRIETLQPFIDDDPNISQRIHHEKCLYFLYGHNYTSLECRIDEWQPEKHDPVWSLRKAAILTELNRYDESANLVNHSLSKVRELFNIGNNLAAPSREGWILWLALALEYNTKLSSGNNLISKPSAFQRWDKLAPYKSDAFSQKHTFVSLLMTNYIKEKGPLFDLGYRLGKTISYSDVSYQEYILARRAIRLCEIAGLPPTVNQMTVGSDLLEAAVNKLTLKDYKLRMSISLYVVDSENNDTFKHVWSRVNVALLPVDEVIQMVDDLKNTIDFIVSDGNLPSKDSIHWVKRLQHLIEVLSRLSLRLPPDRAEEFIKTALAYYKMEIFSKRIILAQPLTNLLNRAWEAIPPEQKTLLSLDILNEPISGSEILASSEYPDPGMLLYFDYRLIAPVRTFANEDQWVAAIQKIITALKAGGNARNNAIYRLKAVVRWNKISPSEEVILADALWHPEHLNYDGLPCADNKMAEWELILLPQPEPGLAEKILRKKWFAPNVAAKEFSIANTLKQISFAISGLERTKCRFILTDKETEFLFSLIEQWVKLPIPVNNEDDPLDFYGDDTNDIINYLGIILDKIKVPLETAISLYEKAEKLVEVKVPVNRLLVSLIKFLPDKTVDIVMYIRKGLASNNEDMAKEAITSIREWFISSVEESLSIPKPPDDLLREIALIIATRREAVLYRALGVAYWVFIKGDKKDHDLLLQLITDGLSHLIEELSYDRMSDNKKDEDVPLLRSGCAQLSLAMAQAGFSDNEVIAKWIKALESDPFPEVRYAKGSNM